MKRRLLRLALAGPFLLAALLAAGLGHGRWRQAQAPPQPIAFPHTVHAGQLGLACPFCHIDVERSPRAGVPPVDKCLSCHRSIATERPEIQKLLRFEREQEPIRWNRVHSLPAHVYFSHERHVKMRLDCAACHGAVAEMAAVRRVRSLEMGWCVTCHRALGGPRDCAACHK